jgi:hypothetical protein
MAKKETAVTEVKAEEVTTMVEEEGDFPFGTSRDAEPGAFTFDTDFNVDEEYKVPPVIPAASYEGFVTNVHFDAGDMALVWDVTLQADADVYMSDNETPVNGNVLYYKNWFPREGDDLVRTKTGKMTKRQAKINMIMDFQKKMRIDMSTPEAILEHVQNAEWIGLEVIADVEVREWEGRVSNQIKNMKAA